MAAKTFEDWWKTEWHSDEEAGFLACWNAAIDTMEAQNTGAQQLKLEIAAARNEHLSHCNTPDFGLSHVALMEKLRQLSSN